MSGRDQRMYNLLMRWPASGTWSDKTSLDSEDDKLQELFWELFNEYTNLQGPMRLSPWLKTVLEAGANAQDSYIPIHTIHTLRKAFTIPEPADDDCANRTHESSPTSAHDSGSDTDDSNEGSGSMRMSMSGNSSGEERIYIERELTLVDFQESPTGMVFGDIDLETVEDPHASGLHSEDDSQMLFTVMRKRPSPKWTSGAGMQDGTSSSPVSTSDLSVEDAPAERDFRTNVDAIAQWSPAISLNSPPSRAIPLSQVRPSALPQAPPVRRPVTLKPPASPLGWNSAEHDERLLMDFRQIVCDRCFVGGFWCTYFVTSVLEVDRRKVLTCEHCKKVKHVCAHQRAQLTPTIREAAAFGTLFITKRWIYQQRFVPTCSIITPEGQIPARRARTLATGALTTPIMYNGTSPQRFSIEVPTPRAMSQRSSSTKRSRTGTHSPHSVDDSSTGSPSTRASPLLRTLDSLPPMRDSSQELNTVRLLAGHLQAFSVAPSVDVDEIQEISERLDVVHETLVMSQVAFSADRISFAQHVHNL